MEKKIICLYGGPGTGKSTTAAHVFALLKQKGINSELVTEYVKNWMWEDRKILPGDQVYIFAKQSRLERLKYKDVDVIVTESPVWLYPIYERKFEPEPHICEVLVKRHSDLATSMGFSFVHVFLNRVKAYSPIGRYQTEEEAKQIDKELLAYLKEANLEFFEVPADHNAANTILDVFGYL